MSVDLRARPSRLPFLILCGLLLSALPATAQSSDAPEAGGGIDTDSVLAEVRDLQLNFERFREQRLPAPVGFGEGGCDEIIGRMCFRFDGEDAGEDLIADEPVEVTMARDSLIRGLNEAGSAVPDDPWVLGQRIFYLIESGRTANAESVARNCRAGEAWWCDALLGLTLHVQGSSVAAREAFEEALAAMPQDEAARWRSDAYLFGGERKEAFDDGESPDSLVERRLWAFADPLFLVEGNDRLTEHWARKTLGRIRADAGNPFGLEWGDDLDQLLVRYGVEIGWERTRRLQTGLQASDPRHIIGYTHPKAQEFLPPPAWLDAPATIPEGAWTLNKATPHTGWAPRYAPDLDALDLQLARFRRGDSLFLVAAYQPAPAPDPSLIAERAGEGEGAGERNPFQRDNPFVREPAPSESPSPVTGPVESGLFLLDESGEVVLEKRGEEASAVVTAMAPTGRYVASVEVLEPGARQAWRARQGALQDSLPFDLAAVSDILVVEADGTLPETLDEAIPNAMKGVRLRPGDPMTLAWEVYGLRPGQTAAVSVGLSSGPPGLLRRAGEFLGLIDPDDPVMLSFEDAGPDALQTIFRAVTIALPPEIEPGEYTLELDVVLPGREPLTARRRVIIEG